MHLSAHLLPQVRMMVRKVTVDDRDLGRVHVDGNWLVIFSSPLFRLDFLEVVFDASSTHTPILQLLDQLHLILVCVAAHRRSWTLISLSGVIISVAFMNCDLSHTFVASTDPLFY